MWNYGQHRASILCQTNLVHFANYLATGKSIVRFHRRQVCHSGHNRLEGEPFNSIVSPAVNLVIAGKIAHISNKIRETSKDQLECRKFRPKCRCTIYRGPEPYPEMWQSRLSSGRLRVNGRLYNCNCLLDSGADINLVPTHLAPSNQLQPTETELIAANGTAIANDGQVKMTVAAKGLNKILSWSFAQNTIVCKDRTFQLISRSRPTLRCKICISQNDVSIPPPN